MKSKPIESELCMHNLYCVKRREMQFPEPCRNDYADGCGQIRKFYDKYGDSPDSEFFGSGE